MKVYSIGYNGNGQRFFDYLNEKNKYIHSFFFNPTNNFYKNINWKEEVINFENFNTYDYEANILFNLNVNLESRDILRAYLNLNKLNLTSVTVLNQISIDMFKKIKKGLKYHISVNTPINSVKELTASFKIEDIYCINLGYKYIFDLSFMEQIKKLGIKVKIIPNEMCVYDREEFLNQINKKACVKNEYCKEKCWDVLTDDFEWINLTRQGFNQLFLSYFEDRVDIIKLSTRGLKLNEIDKLITSFVIKCDSNYFNRYLIPESISNEFIDMRFSCKHNCFECRYCERIFNEYIKE